MSQLSISKFSKVENKLFSQTIQFEINKSLFLNCEPMLLGSWVVRWTNTWVKSPTAEAFSESNFEFWNIPTK